LPQNVCVVHRQANTCGGGPLFDLDHFPDVFEFQRGDPARRISILDADRHEISTVPVYSKLA
jgi:hypothetical protein